MNPREWFQFLDTDGSRRIDKNTVIQTLEAILPIDTENLRQVMDERIWAEWDTTADGHISEPEFFARDGLFEWVRVHQHDIQMAKARGPTPALQDAEGWFKHWDFSKCGDLCRSDVLRAMCEAASVSSLEPKKVEKLKVAIEAIWQQNASADGTLAKNRFFKAGIAQLL